MRKRCREREERPAPGPALGVNLQNYTRGPCSDGGQQQQRAATDVQQGACWLPYTAGSVLATVYSREHAGNSVSPLDHAGNSVSPLDHAGIDVQPRTCRHRCSATYMPASTLQHSHAGINVTAQSCRHRCTDESCRHRCTDESCRHHLSCPSRPAGIISPARLDRPAPLCAECSIPPSARPSAHL